MFSLDDDDDNDDGDGVKDDNEDDDFRYFWGSDTRTILGELLYYITLGTRKFFVKVSLFLGPELWMPYHLCTDKCILQNVG